jgi:hypothetical protein
MPVLKSHNCLSTFLKQSSIVQRTKKNKSSYRRTDIKIDVTKHLRGKTTNPFTSSRPQNEKESSAVHNAMLRRQEDIYQSSPLNVELPSYGQNC